MVQNPVATRLSLPFAAWPEIDRQLWDEAVRDDDPLEALGPAAVWSAGSRRKRIYGYGRWLRFLPAQGWLRATQAAAARATRPQVEAYHAELRATLAATSVRHAIEELCAMLAVIEPMADWSWLRAMRARVDALAQPVRPVQPRVVPARELWRAGLTAMAEADAGPRRCRRYHASAFRDGLAVAMLAACPLRRRSFVGLELGRHFVAIRDGYMLRFEANDLKYGTSLDFPPPAELGPWLAHYLDHYRPILAARGTSSGRLWLNADGMPLTDVGMSERIAKVTVQQLGRPVNMHLFGHAAATSMAIDDPHYVQLITALLGHTRLGTSERYYNVAGSLEAARSYQDKLSTEFHLHRARSTK